MMRHLERGSLVLVTGGAGFLGAHVVRRLSAAGYRIRVLDDLSRGRRERLEGVAVDLVVDDVRSERAVRLATSGAAAVVHLAAPSARATTAREERIGHDVTVTGTLALCTAARDARVARFVFASSAAVYGPRPFLLHEDLAPAPACAEGAQKLAAEAYVKMFAARDGLAACVLRLFSIYGPGQDGNAPDASFVARMVGCAAEGRAPTIHGDGLQTRDLIHVEDAAAAVVAALGAAGVSGRVFNVASGEAVAVRHVAALLSELAGGLPSPRYAPAASGEPRDVRASIAAAAAQLGVRPRVRLRDGLKGCLDAARELRPASRLAAPARPTRVPAPAAAPAPAAGAAAAAPEGPGLFADRPPSWAIEDGSPAPLPLSDDDVLDSEVDDGWNR